MTRRAEHRDSFLIRRDLVNRQRDEEHCLSAERISRGSQHGAFVALDRRDQITERGRIDAAGRGARGEGLALPPGES
ncbi:MAG: hypothetical protein FJW27_07070 [Acidimicrobiia bacterium]|nr:hypothetical protein [Acidimicrobiia bacterium]